MGTTAQKLQRVLDTKEGLKDTINTYLGQDITSAIPFKDYETYIKNFYGSLPKTSYAEGSNITLSNCLKGKLDYEDDKVGYGDTYQYSTNGYQLLNIPDIAEFTQDGITLSAKNGTINVKGTATSAFGYEIISNVGITTTGNSTLVRNGSDTSNSAIGIYLTIGGTEYNGTNQTSHRDYRTFTATGVVTAFRIRIANGTAIDGTYQLKPMLYLGDYDSTKEWEKYTGGIPAPNPSYPQPIQVVTGEQEVVVRGKNLASELEQGGLNSSGQTTTSSTRVRSKHFIDVHSNTTYVVNTTSNAKVIVIEYKADETFIQQTTSSWSTPPYSFTTSGNCNKVKLLFYGSSSSAEITPSYIENLQLETGNQATPYEPYITPITKQLSLGNKELFEDSEIVRVSEGNWKYVDNYIRYIGTLSYNSFSADYKRALVRMSISASEVCISGSDKIDYCTIAKSVTGSVATTKSNASFTVRYKDTSNNNVFFWFDDFTTAEIAEAFFTNREFNIVYKLETPIKTPITDTNLINQLEDIYNMQSVNGTTIIEINGNLPMIIKCRALKGE